MPPKFWGWHIHPQSWGGGVSEIPCFTVFFKGFFEGCRPKFRGKMSPPKFCKFRVYGLTGIEGDLLNGPDCDLSWIFNPERCKLRKECLWSVQLVALWPAILRFAAAWRPSFCDCGLRVCCLWSSDHLKYRGELGLWFSDRSRLRPAGIWICGQKPKIWFPLGNRLRFLCGLELGVRLRPKSLAICGCGNSPSAQLAVLVKSCPGQKALERQGQDEILFVNPSSCVSKMTDF